MKKMFFLFLVIFLMANNVWSKPVLEIASYQRGDASGRLLSAIDADDFFTPGRGPVDLKKDIKTSFPQAYNIETRLYVDDKGFVVIGDSEPVPDNRIQKNDLFVSGNLFVAGDIYNDRLKAEIDTLKSEIANLKAEIRALRK